MTLNRNPENFHAQIEQAAFAPSNIVPGIGFSPDKMLLGRVFSYADAHRYRIGPNFHQLEVNRPINGPQNHYTIDGPMRVEHTGNQAVYAPNSEGRSFADGQGPAEDGWEADGEMVRSAYNLHAEDDDFGQAGTLVREVWDDALREQFCQTVAGHLLGGVHGEVLERAFWYWDQVDAACGAKIRQLVAEGQGAANPGGEADEAKDTAE